MTKVTVSTEGGLPVRVQPFDPKTGENGAPEILPANQRKDYYLNAERSITITEVTPGSVATTTAPTAKADTK